MTEQGKALGAKLITDAMEKPMIRYADYILTGLEIFLATAALVFLLLWLVP